eukprot:10733095-Prorocentrum_lima.AAC.1
MKTPAIFETGLELSDKLVNHIIKDFKVGQVFSLTRDGGEHVFFGLVGYIRLRRPRQVVALAMQSECGHASLR